MTSPDWRATGWRLLAALTALSAFAIWQPFFWAELFSSLYGPVVSALLPNDATFALGTRLDQAEPVFALSVSFVEPFDTAQGTLLPGMAANLLTSAGHAAEPAILILGICLAWHPVAPAHRACAVALGVLMIALLQIVTVPFLLAGSFYTKVCGAACIEVSLWAWQGWLSFLENGGDWAISVLAAITCLWLPQRVQALRR